jgi:two-component system sensor histidine kinase ChiS
LKQAKKALTSVFSEAINTYYQKNFFLAKQKFGQILTEIPQDRAASFYLKRCEYYLETGIPHNWEGVEILVEK